MSSQSQSAVGRRRSNIRQYSVEDQALNMISKEAEARLAAKRLARAEAREIRMKEIEKQHKNTEEKSDKIYELTNEHAAAKIRQQIGGSRRGSSESNDSGADGKDIDFKEQVRELEDKYKAAMMTSAQLDNEKQSLVYQVELLKDQLEEQDEGYTELQREYKDKCREYELQKRDMKNMEHELNILKQQLELKDRLIQESGFVIMSNDKGEPILEKQSSSLSATANENPLPSGDILVSPETKEFLEKAGDGTLGTPINFNPTTNQSVVSKPGCEIFNNENKKNVFASPGIEAELIEKSDLQLETASKGETNNKSEQRKTLEPYHNIAMTSKYDLLHASDVVTKCSGHDIVIETCDGDSGNNLKSDRLKTDNNVQYRLPLTQGNRPKSSLESDDGDEFFDAISTHTFFSDVDVNESNVGKMNVENEESTLDGSSSVFEFDAKADSEKDGEVALCITVGGVTTSESCTEEEAFVGHKGDVEMKGLVKDEEDSTSGILSATCIFDECGNELGENSKIHKVKEEKEHFVKSDSLQQGGVENAEMMKCLVENEEDGTSGILSATDISCDEVKDKKEHCVKSDAHCSLEGAKSDTDSEIDREDALCITAEEVAPSEDEAFVGQQGDIENTEMIKGFVENEEDGESGILLATGISGENNTDLGENSKVHEVNENKGNLVKSDSLSLSSLEGAKSDSEMDREEALCISAEGVAPSENCAEDEAFVGHQGGVENVEMTECLVENEEDGTSGILSPTSISCDLGENSKIPKVKERKEHFIKSDSNSSLEERAKSDSEMDREDALCITIREITENHAADEAFVGHQGEVENVDEMKSFVENEEDSPSGILSATCISGESNDDLGEDSKAHEVKEKKEHLIKSDSLSSLEEWAKSDSEMDREDALCITAEGVTPSKNCTEDKPLVGNLGDVVRESSVDDIDIGNEIEQSIGTVSSSGAEILNSEKTDAFIEDSAALDSHIGLSECEKREACDLKENIDIFDEIGWDDMLCQSTFEAEKDQFENVGDIGENLENNLERSLDHGDDKEQRGEDTDNEKHGEVALHLQSVSESSEGVIMVDDYDLDDIIEGLNSDDDEQTCVDKDDKEQARSQILLNGAEILDIDGAAEDVELKGVVENEEAVASGILSAACMTSECNMDLGENSELLQVKGHIGKSDSHSSLEPEDLEGALDKKIKKKGKSKSKKFKLFKKVFN